LRLEYIGKIVDHLKKKMKDYKLALIIFGLNDEKKINLVEKYSK